MLKIYSILLLILIGCTQENNQKNINKPTKANSEIKNSKDDLSIQKKNSEIMNLKDDLSIQKLMLLTKSKAIEKYGTPSSLEQFILNDAQGEFRNSISDKYTEKERQNESISIEELTWEKSEDTWITIWYEVTDQIARPKTGYVWKKGMEF